MQNTCLSHASSILTPVPLFIKVLRQYALSHQCWLYVVQLETVQYDVDVSGFFIARQTKTLSPV